MAIPPRYGGSNNNSYILEDVEGTTVVTYDNKGGSQGTRKFRARFSDISDITTAMLGYVDGGGVVHNPDFFPARGTNLVCERVQWDPHGVMAADGGLGLPTFTHAYGTATYVPQKYGFDALGATVPLNLYDETISGTEETFPILGQNLYWGSGGADPADPKTTVAHLTIVGLDIKMVFKRRNTINTALIANMNKTNNAYVQMRTTGLCFPPESLLMGKPTFTRVQDGASAFYDISVNMLYKQTEGTVIAAVAPTPPADVVGGWNQYYNPKYFDKTTKKFKPRSLWSNRDATGAKLTSYVEVKNYEPVSFAFLTNI